MLVHSPLASIVSDEMLAPILTLILLYTICLFFLLPLLLRVFLYLWFSAVVLCSYVWFSLYLSYLGFVESLGLVSRWFFLIKFGSVFFFFFNLSLSPILTLFSFWDSSYTNIRPFDFVPQSLRLCLFLFHCFCFPDFSVGLTSICC